MCEPLKVEKTDHPDLVGGIVWTDRELDWIRAYGKRCYNYGFAKGIAITQAHDRALDDENKWPEVEVDHG